MSLFLNEFGFYPQILFSPADDDGAASGGGGEADQGGDDDQGESGDQGSGMIDKSAIIKDDQSGGDVDASNEDKKEEAEKTEKAERPEYIKEKFWDAEKGEVRLEELAKANGELEKKLGQGVGKPPKTSGDYELNVEDDRIKALFPDGDPSKDKLMQKLNDKMHSKGVSQDVYGAAMNIALEAIAEHQAENPAPAAPDVKEERAKLGANADKIIENQTQFLSQLYNQGHVDGETIQEMLILTETAAGMKGLQAIRNYYGDQQKIPQNLSPGGGEKTADELRSMMADSKYGQDPEYTASVDKAYEKRYGTGTSGESMRSAL